MRKGQASVEYLTTYGWVFLVIMIALGGLIYFGFFDAENFTPDRCWFGSQIVCEDYRIERTSTASSLMQFRVRNNLGKPIYIQDITSGDPSTYPLSGCTTGQDIAVGAIEDLECVVDQTLFRGDKYSIPTVITFRRNDSVSAPLHNISGEIYTIAR